MRVTMHRVRSFTKPCYGYAIPVWEREGFIERVSAQALGDEVVQHILTHAKLRPVYFNVSTDEELYAPRWIAQFLKLALLARDSIAGSWGLWCLEMGLRAPREIIPWPSWLRFGWR